MKNLWAHREIDTIEREREKESPTDRGQFYADSSQPPESLSYQLLLPLCVGLRFMAVDYISAAKPSPIPIDWTMNV